MSTRSELAGASSSSEGIARAARLAFEASQLLSPSERVTALHLIRDELAARKDDILLANARDMEVSSLKILVNIKLQCRFILGCRC